MATRGAKRGGQGSPSSGVGRGAKQARRAAGRVPRSSPVPSPAPLYAPTFRLAESFGGIEPRNLELGAQLVFPSCEMLGALNIHAVTMSLQADCVSATDALNKLLIVSTNREVAISLADCEGLLDALLYILDRVVPPIPCGPVVPLQKLLAFAETQDLTNKLGFVEEDGPREDGAFPFFEGDEDGFANKSAFEDKVSQALAALTVVANLSFAAKNEANAAFLAGSRQLLYLLARCLTCGEDDPVTVADDVFADGDVELTAMPSDSPLDVFRVNVVGPREKPRERSLSVDVSDGADPLKSPPRTRAAGWFQDVDENFALSGLSDSHEAEFPVGRPRDRPKLAAPDAVEFRELAMFILSNIAPHLRFGSVDDARFILAVLTDHASVSPAAFPSYSTGAFRQFTARAAEVLSKLGIKNENREMFESISAPLEFERAVAAFMKPLLRSPIIAGALKPRRRSCRQTDATSAGPTEWTTTPTLANSPPVPWSQEEHGNLELILCALGTLAHVGGPVLVSSAAFRRSGCSSMLRRLAIDPDALPPCAPDEAAVSIRKRALNTLKELKADSFAAAQGNSTCPLLPIEILEVLVDRGRCNNRELCSDLAEIIL